jgi:general secretion pathway protein A
MLRNALDERFSPFVHLVFPQMSAEELLAYLAVELGRISDSGRTPGVHQSIGSIAKFLAENTGRGKHAVVAIDEAHLINDAQTLEALRLLLNFEFDGQPGLTLLLVGQPGILPILDRTPQLEERLGVKCLLRPLTQAETTEYVGHRLNLAGAAEPIFDTDALRTLHELTHGIARRINRLCDLAMLIGYAEERSTITSEQLESVSRELVAVAPE